MSWLRFGYESGPRTKPNKLRWNSCVITSYSIHYTKLYDAQDCEILIVAYGTTARIVKNVIKQGEKNGIKIGLIRPITLWPFPSETIAKYAGQSSVKSVFSVELSTGQMIDDVKIAVNGAKPVYFFGRTGGVVPLPEEIYENRITSYNVCYTKLLRCNMLITEVNFKRRSGEAGKGK